MATDPIRLGLTLLLVTRRRAMLNLFAFWLGGMVAAVFLATAVLVVARDLTLSVIRSGIGLLTEVRSALGFLEGGRLQIAIGVFVLIIALRMVARDRAQARVPVGVGGPSAVAPQPSPPGMIARMAARTERMLTCEGFVWPAFLVGLTSSAPPIESVTALTVIMASGASLGIQFSAFVVFIILVLTVIEVPLLAYLAMPRQTEAMMLRLQQWLREHGRKFTQGLFSVMGAWAVVQGFATL